jgi:competence protein ComEA
VRERKSAEKDVAARLRSVLSGSVGDGSVGDGSVDTPAGDAVRPPESWPEVVPEVRPKVPPEVRLKARAEPRPESRPESKHEPGLGDLSELGEPLRWSDIIPAWPDDVDLGPASESSSDEEGRAPPSAALREPTGGFRVGTPWASPPGAPHTPAETIPRAASLTLGEPMKDGFDGVAGNVRRPLPPPNWVLPEEDFEDALASRPAWSAPESDDEPPELPELTSAGAFGGDRKVGIRAFDPGRRGVRALAGVAAVAILVAALLAWRARPHVDPVAPPSFDAVATTPAASPTGRGGPSAATAELVVAVGGKVRKPGLVRLPPGARVADALAAAGGANPGVDVALLNLARKVVDGELIMVGVTPPPGVATAPAAGGPSAAGGPVNLNTATLADLDTLPGVGPVLAQRILDARESQGGFHAVSDLRKVDGIGDARYEQLKDLVTV